MAEETTPQGTEPETSSQTPTETPPTETPSSTPTSDPTHTNDEPTEQPPSADAEDPVTAEAIMESVELPEGYQFNPDDPLLGEFVEALNAKDLTKAELATKLTSLYAKATEANVQQYLAVQEEWQKELEGDPNIGGEKLNPALMKIDGLIRDYASSFGDKAANVDAELRSQFDITGAGNNPNIIRFLHWIALQSGEGAPLSGNPAGGERSRAERMFST